MNDKGKQFYDFVKSKGLKVPDSYEEFQTKMQDENTASQFREFVSSKGIKVPDDNKEFQSIFVSSEEGEPVNFTQGSEEPSQQSTTTTSETESKQQETGGETPAKPTPLVEQPLPTGVAAPVSITEQKFDYVWETEQPKQLQTPKSEKQEQQEQLEQDLKQDEPTYEGYYEINGTPVSGEELRNKLLDRDFVNKFQEDAVDVRIDNDQHLQALAQKQKEAGSELGDKWDYLQSGLYRLGAGVEGLPAFVGDVIEETTGVELPESFTRGSRLNAAMLDYKAKEAEQKTRQYKEGFLNSIAEGNYLDAFNQGNNMILASAPTTAYIAATGGAGLPVSMVASIPVLASAEYQAQDVEGLDKGDQIIRATAFGAAEAFGEAVTAGIAKSNFNFFKEGYKKLVKEAAKTGNEQAILNVAEQSSKELLKNTLKSYGIDTQKEGVSEALTGVAQDLTDDLLGVKDMSFESYINNALENYASGIYMGGVLGGGKIGGASMEIARREIIDPKKREKVIENVNASVNRGEITPEQAEEVVSEIKAEGEALDAIPEDMLSDNRVFELEREKQRLKNQIEGKDDILVTPQKERIQQIDEELKTIANDVRKETPQTEEGGVRDRQQEGTTQEEATDSEVSGQQAQEGARGEEGLTPDVRERAETDEGLPSTQTQEEVEQQTQDTDAIQERQAKEVDVREQAVPSEEMVGEVREEEAPSEATQEEVEVTEETPSEEAKQRAVDFGYKAPIEAVRRVNKRLGKDYTKIEDIPDSELQRAQQAKTAEQKAIDETVEGKMSNQPKVTQSEKVALKKQIRDYARGIREGAKEQRKVATEVSGLLKDLRKKGKLTSKQAATLANAAAKVNFGSPKSVIQFADRIQKTSEIVDYNEKLDTAKKVRATLKPRKNSLAGDEYRIKQFKKINPNSVTNIDEYIEIGQDLKKAVASTRRTKDEVSLQQTPIYEKIDNFLEKESKAQEEYNNELLKEVYDYLGDLNLTTEELNEIVQTLEDKQDSTLSEERKKEISESLDIVKSFYNQELEQKLKDDNTLSEQERGLIRQLIDGSIEPLYFNQKARAIRVIENIIQNNSFADVYNVVNDIEVAKATQDAKDSGIVGITPRLFGIKTLAREYSRKVMGLTESMRNIFRGENTANRISIDSGITDIDLGLVRRHNRHNKLVDKYNKMVDQMVDHNTSENLANRSVYAFITRNDGTTPTQIQKEFNRRKSIILEQEKYFQETDGFEKEQELWSNAIDKLNIREANNQSELTISKDNKKIVDFFVNNFSEIYPEHEIIAEQVYNKILPQDKQYTPDVYTSVDAEQTQPDLDESVYFKDTIDTNESSMLMGVTKSAGLPKNERGQVTRVLSLDFDSQMMRKLDEAYMEIETAPALNKLKKFVDRRNLLQFMEPDAASVFRQKVTSYIQSEKGSYQADLDQKDLNAVRKLVDFMANTVAIRLLGSIYQPIKQTIPVMLRAYVNFRSARPMGDMFSAYFGKNKKLMELAQNYGTVAMRGKKSTVDVDNLNARLKGSGFTERMIADNIGGERGKQLRDFLRKTTEVYTAPLEFTLEKPDVRIAKATWAAYYAEKVRDLEGEFDIEKHLKNPNKEAVQFANSMVAQTQNESQGSKMGDVFKSRELTTKFLRNILFPFANFVQSLRSNIYNNLVILTGKTASKADKKAAFSGLVGAAVEILAFNYVAMYLRQLNSMALESLLGLDEEDEEDPREMSVVFGVPMNKKEKRIFLTNVLQDLSPLPIVDNAMVALVEYVNKGIKKAKGEEYDKFKDNIVYAPLSTADGFLNSGGKFGAAYDLIQDLDKTLDMADFFVDNDTYTKRSMFGDSEKEIPIGREDDLNLALGLYAYYLLAPSTKEIGSAAKAIIKDVENEVSNKKSGSGESVNPQRGRLRPSIGRATPLKEVKPKR